MSESKEVVIDGKLMNIGKTGSWRDQAFQINFGADLGPDDPGSGLTGQVSRARQQGHRHVDIDPSLSFETIKENEIHNSDEKNNIKNTDSNDCSKLKYIVKICSIILLVIAYNAYIAYALHHHLRTGRVIDWCGGLGFLIIVTVIVYISLFYFHIIKKIIPWRKVGLLVPTRLIRNASTRQGRWLITIIVLAAFATFLIIDTKNDRQRLISAGGLVVIIFLGTVFSTSWRHIVWRQVVWGLSLQFIFGLLILRWSYGKLFFDCIGEKVDTFLAFTDAGSSFVFGYLVNQKPFLLDKLKNGTAEYEVAGAINAAQAINSIVVFKALSTVYFFSFLVSMLFYWGVLQWLVMKIGWLLQVTIGTTACESLNAAANIFLGQATAPFIIKPYLSRLTLSEIHAIMTGGFATIAGTVLAAYISFGVPSAHLVSASVMSAPAALAFAKLFYPETEKSKTKAENIIIEAPQEANVLDAATQGATSAGILVVNITAIVVAFIAFMAFLNSIVAFLGDLVGVSGLSFDVILGKIFIPLSFLMGVDWEDCEKVSRLIGIKTILNEFIAYRELGELIKAGEISQRSQVIATYALCGFANPGSIGVQLATLSSMAPDRKSDFAAVVFRAFISGSVACFLTACIAGTLYDQHGYSSLFQDSLKT